MRIGLFDVDRTGFPNVALMKLSAWHKAEGDTVLPLNSGERADRRYASVVFTWNRPKAAACLALGAIVGGSGWNLSDTLPPHVEAMNCGKQASHLHIIRSGVEVCPTCLRALVPPDQLAEYLERPC